MFESIAQKLFTTAIAVGSVLFGTVEGTNATFTNIDYARSGNNVVISTRLENCFTEELDKLIQSGKSLQINFRVAVHNARNKEVMTIMDFYHQVRYNLVDEFYQIELTESERTVTAVTLEEVHKIMATVGNVVVLDANNMEPDQSYRVEITAYMETIQLSGREKEINLMNYWNNKEPISRTEAFTRTQVFAI